MLEQLILCLLLVYRFRGCDGCGGSWSGSTGEITSPNYPSNYSNNLDCTYNIQVDRAITLTVQDFYTEINYDFVKVYDSYNTLVSDLHGFVSGGYQVPRASIKYKVVFTTDDSVLSRGFKISWTAFNCDTALTGNNGSLTSPYYPSNYVEGVSCSYTVDAGSTLVSLTFEDFLTEKTYDVVKVYDKNSTLLETVSGDIGWYVVVSATYYRLVFTVDRGNTMRGFKATWTEAPSSTQRPSDIYTQDKCVNVSFHKTASSGMSLKAVERFFTSLRPDCIRLCMQRALCTYVDFLDTICGHYTAGTGGNTVGGEIWKRD